MAAVGDDDEVPVGLQAAHPFYQLMIAMTFDKHDEYWDGVYMQEDDKLDENKKDALYMWFGEAAIAILLATMQIHVPDMSTPVLDVGTGNGHLVELLLAGGYRNVTGTDKCARAIEIARRVHLTRDAAATADARVEFTCDDIVQTQLAPNSFGAIIDKGMLDTIALSNRRVASAVAVLDEDDPAWAANFTMDSDSDDDPDEMTLGPKEDMVYLRTMLRLLRPDGLLVLMSMNHDEEELERLMKRARITDEQQRTISFVMIDTMTEHLEQGLRLHVYRRTVWD